MIAVKYNEPVQYNKELHISDGSIKNKNKGAKELYTKTSYMRFLESYLMQAGKLVEKSLHRHQSHFSSKSPATGWGRHWLL